MKFISFLVFLSLFIFPTFASTENNSDFRTTEEILAEIHASANTECASKIFTDALIENSNKISETALEQEVRSWAYTTMLSADTLERVLECPEIKSASDTETIIFSPVVYTFPNGRTITIKYDTQPKVLKQKLMLAHKKSLPNGVINPDLMDDSDGSKYLNTEPAWYAIMVVQHDSLSDFVGPGKNNTVSIKYIDENIDNIYPHGYYCTSRSAWANDQDTINQVVHKVVDIEDDSNDYYVAGDINLEWVMYAEIAADVIITVVTAGTGQVATGALKGIRASKTGIRLAKNMAKFKKSVHVQKYIQTSNRIAKTTEKISKFEKNMKNAKKYEKALKNIEKARNTGGDVAKYEKEAEQIFESAKKIDPDITKDMLKNPSKMEESIKTLGKESDEAGKALEKTLEENKKLIKEKQKALKNASPEDRVKIQQEIDDLESVDKYIDAEKQFKNVIEYRNSLRAFQRPQTGNIFARALKSLKAANTGAKTLNSAAKVARAGMSSRSAKLGYQLFDATLKHGARLARFERDVGLLYGAVAFLGDMYDKTSTTSQEFSNGIEFKPLGLLSADDLEGQDNVVNYGMWLMWVGNSTDPADDDAAYLQAMDFASKFYYELDNFQDEHNANCNVDIYVVHPFIKLDETNTANPKGEMYYLFMNEIPWTTNIQFNEQVPDIEDWERVQADLGSNDPEKKYHSHDNKNTDDATDTTSVQE